MNYIIKIWQIRNFIDLYDSSRLILSPPYQRNFIWTAKDQKELIDTILIKDFPIPSIFIREIQGGKYEIVDGQQRLRTIFSYYDKHFNQTDGLFTDEMKEKFLSYTIGVTIISNADEEGAIEEFYSRVNKTGKKLNKPELAKAEYFDTEFLSLNEELAKNASFQNLNLFTELSSNRMNDIDLISELIALLYFDIYDKKEKVDELYDKDISIEEKEKLKQNFLNIIEVVTFFDHIHPIKQTRYRQRNDFYTMFGFINKYSEFGSDEFGICYKVLLAIDSDISPSNDFCEPFKDYAINCVTQSNSKKARLNRLAFFESVLVNDDIKPNLTQIQILNYYELDHSHMINLGGFYTIDFNKIFELKELYL